MFNRITLPLLATLGLILSGCAHGSHHNCGCGKKEENSYQCSAKKESCGKDKCDCGGSCKHEDSANKTEEKKK